jgi:hypothetical protein
VIAEHAAGLARPGSVQSAAPAHAIPEYRYRFMDHPPSNDGSTGRPCRVQVHFYDAAGDMLAGEDAVLAPGVSRSFDPRLPGRQSAILVRPEVRSFPPGSVVSVGEVINAASGVICWLEYPSPRL